MKAGGTKEIKTHRFGEVFGLALVRELTKHGNEVFVESTAGHGIGVDDSDFEEAGARILPDAEQIFEAAEMIVKVKEPQAVERAMLRADHTLFTYLHLAPDAPQTQDLVDSGETCIA